MVAWQIELPGETAVCTCVGVGLSIVIAGGIPLSELSFENVLPITFAFATLMLFSAAGQVLAYAIVYWNTYWIWLSSAFILLLLTTFFCWRSDEFDASFVETIFTFAIKPNVNTTLIISLLIVWLVYFIGAALIVRKSKTGERT